jgi:hypothetical protein
MPTSCQPANIPIQRCGAVGSPVVHGGEEVTFPASKPDSVVAQLDLQYYPERMDSVSLELRTYLDGVFYISYREEWNGESWMCRWDRHDNPHSTRDHFHQPPVARTEDAVDRSYSSDFLAVIELVLDFIDQRLGKVWENEQ